VQYKIQLILGHAIRNTVGSRIWLIYICYSANVAYYAKKKRNARIFMLVLLVLVHIDNCYV